MVLKLFKTYYDALSQWAVIQFLSFQQNCVKCVNHIKGRLSYLSLYKFYRPISSSLQSPFIRSDIEKTWAKNSLPPTQLSALGRKARLYISYKGRDHQPVRKHYRSFPCCTACRALYLFSEGTDSQAGPCSGTKQTALPTHLCTHSSQWLSPALFCHLFSLLGLAPRQAWGSVLYLFLCSLTSHPLLSPGVSGATSTLLRPFNTLSMWLLTSPSPSGHLVNAELSRNIWFFWKQCKESL